MTVNYKHLYIKVFKYQIKMVSISIISCQFGVYLEFSLIKITSLENLKNKN